MSDYGTPPPPSAPGMPPVGGTPMSPPPNNLVFAILSTIFCCLPLGVASIVFAAQVNTKFAQGDYAGAQASADKAKKFALWGAIIGAVLIVISLIANLALLGANS
ncbi:MAG: CD225/dispanin family protein [Beutenbergiaceae bacterium]